MFNQFAKGKFSVDVSGPNHCGPDDTTPKQFDFEVSAVYDDDALDSRGFLLDNTMFKQYFHNVKSTDLSCENLAKKAAVDLFQEAQARAKHIHVKIWAIREEVFIEFLLDRETFLTKKHLLTQGASNGH